MFEDNMVLQRKELSDLTALVTGVIYDLYYTQCYITINKTRSLRDIEEKAINQKSADEVFRETEEFLRTFSFKTESDEVMDLYHRILKKNKGLLLTESNISDIISLVIANCDMPLDIGPFLPHFNSFVDEESEEMKNNLDKLVDYFDKCYIEHNLEEFIYLCNETKPLIDRYVINELEICDLLKSLGKVNNVKVYYLNIESKPSPPLGYSSEFSYPLIPYRVIAYITDDGQIVAQQANTQSHLSVIIHDMNIYQFEDDQEHIDIEIQLRDNRYIAGFEQNPEQHEINQQLGVEDSTNYIIASKRISVSFKDYLKLYMMNDIPQFAEVMLHLLA